MMTQAALVRLPWLSVAAAVATIALETTAWALTGSVGLLSDAAESVVILLAALVGVAALRVASAPADEQHAYGHTKLDRDGTDQVAHEASDANAPSRATRRD